MWLADLFSPAREREFLNLLRQHSGLLTRAARTLHEFVLSGDPLLERQIETIEQQADDVLVKLITALREAFVTPMDRQDIYNLGETIDDMIDYLKSAAAEIALFKVGSTEDMLAMTTTLQTAAEAIDAAIGSLRSDPQIAWNKAREARAAENQVEKHYRRALATLFESRDTAKIFKLREVYRHLSNSADRADAIGRLIGKIVVKAT
jgi:predicted phosphate transport protein (TIGR00153 family)